MYFFATLCSSFPYINSDFFSFSEILQFSVLFLRNVYPIIVVLVSVRVIKTALANSIADGKQQTASASAAGDSDVSPVHSQ